MSKYTSQYTKRYSKSVKLLVKQGKDISKLINVVKQLANGEKLADRYRDHKLNDNKTYKNCRECHIEPDWLLIYEIKDDCLILLLVDTGSHSSLFNM